MKLKAVRDPIGGYRVWGTEVIWARQNECRCCWYVWDDIKVETISEIMKLDNEISTPNAVR